MMRPLQRSLRWWIPRKPKHRRNGSMAHHLRRDSAVTAERVGKLTCRRTILRLCEQSWPSRTSMATTNSTTRRWRNDLRCCLISTRLTCSSCSVGSRTNPSPMPGPLLGQSRRCRPPSRPGARRTTPRLTAMARWSSTDSSPGCGPFGSGARWSHRERRHAAGKDLAGRVSNARRAPQTPRQTPPPRRVQPTPPTTPRVGTAPAVPGGAPSATGLTRRSAARRSDHVRMRSKLSVVSFRRPSKGMRRPTKRLILTTQTARPICRVARR
mmetsp:Transcript_10340/g.26467  ORF Transcript_10340/g.26467 Transcript_10340/m.26467 type:complete len:268 (+) Transcript_10340:85-888(+)